MGTERLCKTKGREDEEEDGTVRMKRRDRRGLGEAGMGWNPLISERLEDMEMKT